jgi:hypothetical protein
MARGTDFIQEVVKPEDGVYVVCNSVGGVTGLKLCLDRPDLVNGIMVRVRRGCSAHRIE